MAAKKATRKRTNRTPKRAATRAVDWAPKFLKSLRENGVVRYACDAANVGRTTAYQRLKDDLEFARGWQVALEESSDMLEAEAIRRAAKGVMKPVYQGGELVGHVQEYSDSLLMFLLKAHRPSKFRETFVVKHDVARELIQKANEQGINVTADPVLSELFAAAGIEGFGPAPDAAVGGPASGSGDSSAAGDAGGLAE